METQKDNAIMLMARETACLIIMNSNIIRQPLMQIISFMKSDSPDKPQNRAAIIYPTKMYPSDTPLSNTSLRLYPIAKSIM